MKTSLVTFLALFFSHSLFADCLSVYQRSENFDEEVEWMESLQSDGVENNEAFWNHSSVTPFLKNSNRHELVERWRLANQKEIFCNPWKLTVEEFLYQEALGVFDETLGTSHQTFPTQMNFRIPKRMDMSANYFYYLEPTSGKIYVKSRKANRTAVIKAGEVKKESHLPIGQRASWYLHDQTGGPLLPAGEKIVEFQAQGELIVAVTNTHQVHLYKPSSKKLPTRWLTKTGHPFRQTLFLPEERRGWSYSVSTNTQMPKKLRVQDFMDEKDVVEYYEDSAGQKIILGLTATIFVLNSNGRSIHYWDTGLPTHFSRAFLTPQYGQFEAMSIGAAGSSIMLLGYDDQGRLSLATRMYDYEINGSCPGLSYCYDQKRCKEIITDGTWIDMLAANRLIPEGWKFHQLPKDMIQTTDLISIFLNGQGNCARLLRLEGKNARGEIGYFEKGICESANGWKFIPYQKEQRQEGKELNFTREKVEQTIAMNFEGAVDNKIINQWTSQVELRNFHFFSTPDMPATLRFYTSNKNEYLDVNLLTTDAWMMNQQNHQHIDWTGRMGGVPKVVLGTLEVPKLSKIERSKLSEEQLELYQFLKTFHHIPSHFTLISNEEHVEITSRTFFDGDTFPKLKFSFKRSSDELAKVQGYFIEKVRKAAPQSTAECQRLLSEIDDEQKEMKKMSRNYFILDAAFGAIYFPSVTVAKVLQITKLKPFFSVIADYGAKTFPQHVKVYVRSAFRKNDNYLQARNLLNQCSFPKP